MTISMLLDKKYTILPVFNCLVTCWVLFIWIWNAVVLFLSELWFLFFSRLGGPEAPADWQGKIPGVRYTLGPMFRPEFSDFKLRLTSNNYEVVVNSYNVFGIVKGSVEPGKFACNCVNTFLVPCEVNSLVYYLLANFNCLCVWRVHFLYISNYFLISKALFTPSIQQNLDLFLSRSISFISPSQFVLAFCFLKFFVL